MSYACYCDYDPPVAYIATIVKARKQHKCAECGGPIEPGERYERVWGLMERGDQPYTPKTCERCVDLRTWVQNNVPCFCWVHGGMTNAAIEAVYQAQQRAPDETRGLHFGLLRRIALRARHNKMVRAA